MRPQTVEDRPAPIDMGDAAMARARSSEDVIVGGVIVRERLAARVVHWCVALTFFLCLFTGLPIWTPYLGFLASLFGGLHVSRLLHPWFGVAFFVASIFMFAQWVSQMSLTAADRKFVTPSGMLDYFRYRNKDADVGKYNGGQKLLFWAAAAGTIGLFASGLVMWFPLSLSQPVREASYLLHDVAFSLFFAMIIGHIYLGTAAEPGTFGSMVHGTVTEEWARLHHPRWYREILDAAAKDAAAAEHH
jgi:formate dehydrogenase gamma subunit